MTDGRAQPRSGLQFFHAPMPSSAWDVPQDVPTSGLSTPANLAASADPALLLCLQRHRNLIVRVARGVRSGPFETLPTCNPTGVIDAIGYPANCVALKSRLDFTS